MPLFSLRSAEDWGIGEIGDIEPFGRWLRRARAFASLQLLPISRCRRARRRHIPRSARWRSIRSLRLDAGRGRLPRDRRRTQLPLGRSGGAAGLPRACLACRRMPPCGRLKRSRAAAVRSRASATPTGCAAPRARGSFAAFCVGEDWWLGDYALYSRAARSARRACRGPTGPMPLRDPASPTRSTMRARHCSDEILFRQYTQWLADEQWASARARSATSRLFGDLPFMVGGDSADVWAHQHVFRFDRVDGHAARCLQRHRAGLGPARLQLGGDGARRSPLAATARAANEPAVRRLSRRPSRRLLPHVLAAAGRETRQLRACRRSRPDQAGRADPSALSGDRIGR